MKSTAQLFDNRPQSHQGETRDPTPFAHWVRKTSELIGRPYMQTVKLVEDWPLHKIERRYKEAMNCSDLTRPHIRWWALRKQDRKSKSPCADCSVHDNA